MSRSTPAALTLFLGLAAISPATAQDTPRPAPDRAAALERRLAELERSLAAALQNVQALRQEVKALAAGREAGSEVKVFRLKYGDATNAARVLQQLLQGPEGKTIRIAADVATNAVLTAGSGNHLQLVEAILTRLDEPPAKKQPDAPAGQEEAAALRRELERVKSLHAATVQRRLDDARTQAEATRERLAWSERMAQKGFLARTEVEAEKQRLKLIEASVDDLTRELQGVPKPADGPVRP